MKKSFFLIAVILCAAFVARAQNTGSLTIFSEYGERFYLIVNGLRQNNVPQTNVRVDNLTQPNYTVKIIFENTALPEINREYLPIIAGNEMQDVTYRIKHDKNGEPKLAALPVSSTPHAQAAPPAPGAYVVHYGQPDAVQVNTQQPNVQVQMGQPAFPQQNVPNNTVVSANVPQTDADRERMEHERLERERLERERMERERAQQAQSAQQQGCNGAYPMRREDFGSAITTIQQQAFDETKLKTAKEIAGSNCLSAEQVTSICKLFTFEQNKLDFAKFAYIHCTDPGNYFKVNGVFTFSSSTDELTRFIQNK